MIFNIDNIPIYFPFETIYPEQYKYIKSVIESLHTRNSLIIQMPCGSGKTISLLSACVSYNIYLRVRYGKRLKTVFVARTVVEVGKSLKELENLNNFIEKNFDVNLYEIEKTEENQKINLLGIGLISKKHLCINEAVKSNRESVDISCSNLISKFSKIKCPFYENLKDAEISVVDKNSNKIEDIRNEDIEDLLSNKTRRVIEIPSSVYTFDSLSAFSANLSICPYYLSRILIPHSDIIIYTYNYILDPLIYEIVNSELDKNSVIIFDEAHNIDNSILEAYSYDLSVDDVRAAVKALDKIENILKEEEAENSKKLENLQKNFPQKIDQKNTQKIDQKNTQKNFTEIITENPNKSENIQKNKLYKKNLIKSESIFPSSVYGNSSSVYGNTIEALIENTKLPGDLRKSSHFVSLLKRLLEYLKTKLKSSNATTQSTASFLASLSKTVYISSRSLAFCSNRFASLLKDLEVETDSDISSLKRVCDLVSLLGNQGVGSRNSYNGIDSNGRNSINSNNSNNSNTTITNNTHTTNTNNNNINIANRTIANNRNITIAKEFCILFEPHDSKTYSPKLTLLCLDPSIGFAGILNFRNLIVTSGTLAPLDFYPRILGFCATMVVDIEMTVSRGCVRPLIVTKGNDQMSLQSDLMQYNIIDTHNIMESNVMESNVIQSNVMNTPTTSLNLRRESSIDTHNLSKTSIDTMTTSFNLRREPSIVRNYGNLLVRLSQTVPDGIVCFFPSYLYLEEIATIWKETRIFEQIQQHKHIFCETPSFQETELALANYRRCVDTGRGAVLLCIARGKVSEGVDFKDGYGRCVVVIGVPYQYTQSVPLLKRLEYLRDNFGVDEGEFLSFDAMRHAAQCLGRVIRSKMDYGLMVLADSRYSRKEKIDKLPNWISQYLKEGALSVDGAVNIGKKYFREMGQSQRSLEALVFNSNSSNSNSSNNSSNSNNTNKIVFSDNYSILSFEELIKKINTKKL